MFIFVLYYQTERQMKTELNSLTYCLHRHKLAQQNYTGRSGFSSAFLLSGGGLIFYHV